MILFVEQKKSCYSQHWGAITYWGKYYFIDHFLSSDIKHSDT